MSSPSSPSEPKKNQHSGLYVLDETTCHALPCSIDFQGMAPTHLYFHPYEDADGLVSSTFRGRGLLALKDEAKEEGSPKAVLLAIHQNRVQIKSGIEQILEWKHEHNPETMRFEAGNGSRVAKADEWFQIANALHQPIPVDEKVPLSQD